MAIVMTKLIPIEVKGEVRKKWRILKTCRHTREWPESLESSVKEKTGRGRAAMEIKEWKTGREEVRIEKVRMKEVSKRERENE